MRSPQAYINVECDECGDETEVPLITTARGNYDERNVDEELRGMGWIIDGEADYCSDECYRGATGKEPPND